MLNKKLLYLTLKLILIILRNIFGFGGAEFYDVIKNSDLIDSDLIDYLKTKTDYLKAKAKAKIQPIQTIQFKTFEEWQKYEALQKFKKIFGNEYPFSEYEYPYPLIKFFRFVYAGSVLTASCWIFYKLGGWG